MLLDMLSNTTHFSNYQDIMPSYLNNTNLYLNDYIDLLKQNINGTLINKNNSTNRKVYDKFSTDENKPYTFMKLVNGELVGSENAQYGFSFGDAGSLVAEDVWCLDYDDGMRDSYIYMTDNQGINELVVISQDTTRYVC